jgi:hypothetical protein
VTQVKVISNEGAVSKFAAEGVEVAAGATVELEVSEDELRDLVAAGWVEPVGGGAAAEE